MQRLIKDQIIFVILIVALIGAGIYFNFVKVQAFNADRQEVEKKKDEITDKQRQIESLRQEQQKREQQVQTTSASGKEIKEVLGQQFSAEASFGIMFDNLIENITSSGVRIRSIDYNYTPAEDKILQTNISGYNACELSFETVSNYLQLQNLLRNLVKETYLTNISEVYIEPYDNDKTILIAKFKVRLYTKTT